MGEFLSFSRRCYIKGQSHQLNWQGKSKEAKKVLRSEKLMSQEDIVFNSSLLRVLGLVMPSPGEMAFSERSSDFRLADGKCHGGKCFLSLLCATS